MAWAGALLVLAGGVGSAPDWAGTDACFALAAVGAALLGWSLRPLVAMAATLGCVVPAVVVGASVGGEQELGQLLLLDAAAVVLLLAATGVGALSAAGRRRPRSPVR